MAANLLQPPFALAATGEQIIDFDLSTVGKIIDLFIIVTSAAVTDGSGSMTINIKDAFKTTGDLIGDGDGPSLPKVFGGATPVIADSEGTDYTLDITEAGDAVKSIQILKSQLANRMFRLTLTNNDPANSRVVQIRGNVL